METDIMQPPPPARQQDLEKLIDTLWVHLCQKHSQVELKRVLRYLQNMLNGLATPDPGPMRYFFKRVYFPGLESPPYIPASDVGIDVSQGELVAMLHECQLAFEETSDGVDHSEYVAPGGKWACVYLKREFEWIASASQRYPQTTKFLQRTRLGTEALFSRLYAGSKIESHSDGANYVTTVHIPLRPAGAVIEVADQVVPYRYGEPICFDSSYYHNVRCEGHEYRDVLLFNVWHPQLSDIEAWAIEEIRRKWALPHTFHPDFGVDVQA